MTKQEQQKLIDQVEYIHQFIAATPFGDLEVVAGWEMNQYVEVEKAVTRLRRWLDRVERWNIDNSGRTQGAE